MTKINSNTRTRKCKPYEDLCGLEPLTHTLLPMVRKVNHSSQFHYLSTFRISSEGEETSYNIYYYTIIKCKQIQMII